MVSPYCINAGRRGVETVQTPYKCRWIQGYFYGIIILKGEMHV